MPQMAPINWLLLFLMFIISLLMFMTMNFYISSYINETSKYKKNVILNNWTW
uniref:ATP synthase complex subunit 8 n=1 Tax=Stylosomus rugithorax TaxID=1425630 RepID=A0A3G1GQ23_9CUCU|nr:ATP synthase F0 subunit 8 [Stylosomus rugithorax]